MAMTATIAVSSATAKPNKELVVTLTVSNSGGSAINMQSVLTTCVQTGNAGSIPAAAGFGLAPLGPGQNISVPASGSLILKYGIVFFAPSIGTTYSIGAICNSADGSVFSPTAATCTVSSYP